MTTTNSPVGLKFTLEESEDLIGLLQQNNL